MQQNIDNLAITSSLNLSESDLIRLRILFLAALEQSPMFYGYLHLFLVPESYKNGEYVFDTARVDRYVAIFFALLEQGYFPAYAYDSEWIRSRSVDSSYGAFSHKSDPVMCEFLEALSLSGGVMWCEIPFYGKNDDRLLPSNYSGLVRSGLREMRLALVESIKKSDALTHRIDCHVQSVLDSDQ